MFCICYLFRTVWSIFPKNGILYTIIKKLKVDFTAISGVKILSPVVFRDNRGFFVESYNKREFLKEAGIGFDFIQENRSFSKKNVIRGLHFQHQFPQGKLISVLDGSILDVVVDLRVNSPTFKRALIINLQADSYQQIWVPPGLAHGFRVLSEHALVSYKVTEYWFPHDEHVIFWNDPALSIDWNIDVPPLISPKDQSGLPFDSVPKFI